RVTRRGVMLPHEVCALGPDLCRKSLCHPWSPTCVNFQATILSPTKPLSFLPFSRRFSRLPKAIVQFRVTEPKCLKNNHVLTIQHLLRMWHVICISSLRC